jgi:hypothetical protein
MIFISAHILNLFRKFRSFGKWDRGMDINPEDETSFTTQYQEAFPKDVENEHRAKHRRVPANNPASIPSSNLGPTTTDSGSG